MNVTVEIMNTFARYHTPPKIMNTPENNFPEEIVRATKVPRFKTKKGHCYVLDDRIVITNKRNISLEEAFEISWWFRVRVGILFIAGAFSLERSYFEFFSDEHVFFSALHIILGIVFGYLGLKEIKASRVKIIKRADIVSAGFYGARFGRNFSFFEILFFENGMVRSIDIELPKKNTSGRSNTQKALEVMHDLMF